MPDRLSAPLDPAPALAQTLPLLLGVGAAGFFTLRSVMSSPAGKDLRVRYEAARKRVAPGAPPVYEVVDAEANDVEDREIKSKYREMSSELSDFDQELRRRTRYRERDNEVTDFDDELRRRSRER